MDPDELFYGRALARIHILMAVSERRRCWWSLPSTEAGDGRRDFLLGAIASYAQFPLAQTNGATP